MRTRTYRTASGLLGLSLIVLANAGCHHDDQAAAGGASGAAASGSGGAMNARMQQFQAKYPGTAALVRDVMGLRGLVDQPQHPVTADQATRLKAVLQPLMDRKTLPQDDAQAIVKQIDANLTPDQQTEIGQRRMQRRGGGGGMGGGRRPGGPGGAGGPGGGGPGGAGYPGGGGGRMGGGAGGGGRMGGGRMGGPGGGQRNNWMNDNMPLDQNVFLAEGGPRQSLTDILQKLQAAQL